MSKNTLLNELSFKIAYSLGDDICNIQKGAQEKFEECLENTCM